MAVQGVPYRLKDDSLYKTDFGKTANFNLSMRPPSDLTTANIESILDCIGAEERQLGGTICSERGLITYRRLKFFRSNGSTMTIIAPQRTNIITQASCIWKVLQTTNFQPVCVQLIGEKHKNVIDDLSSGQKDGGNVGLPIKPPDDAGRNRFFFSGSMQSYKTDTKYGSQIVMGFKMDSNVNQAPYTELESEINGCLKQLIDASICGGAANPRQSRRFIATLLTQFLPAPEAESPDVQSLTIPVAEHTEQEITNCGEALAKKQFVQCLEYEGESNSRLHKLLELSEE